MPTLARIGNFRFFFYSNDRHEPPHVHVQSGDACAKFWLEPVSLANSTGYDASELTKLRKLILEHHAQFQERWHEFFGN